MLDLLTHGRRHRRSAGPRRAVHVLFVNIDFWEYFWVATKQPALVMGYTAGRLVARILIVVVAAVLGASVTTIVWSLVAFELARLAASAIGWYRASGSLGPVSRDSWRRHIETCRPLGLADPTHSYEKRRQYFRYQNAGGRCVGAVHN